jgi:hypothetical protein
VLDCAFLTRDRVAATERPVYATQLPGTRIALTVSGGAAVHPHDALDGPSEDNPYGYSSVRPSTA